MFTRRDFLRLSALAAPGARSAAPRSSGPVYRLSGLAGGRPRRPGMLRVGATEGRSLAVELAPRGVKVHTVNPGFVETPGFPQRGARFRGLASRLVVDPLTPLIVSGDSPGRIQELARAFIHLIQSNLNTTNLFTSHLPRRSDQDLTNGIEEFLAAGVFVLKVNQVDGRFVRTLQVKKMRGTAVAPDEYRFEIAAGKGVALISSELAVGADVEQPLQALEYFQLPKERGE